MITSKSNLQFKRIKKLLTSARARSEDGVFVVEGERIVCEAPAELIETVWISKSYKGSLPEGGLKPEVLSDELFKALSDTVNPQGIMAVIRQPKYSLEEIVAAAGEKSLYVILDDIRDPGNLGTIVRTAEAAGAAVIMSPGCADIFNPKVIRSTMGSIYRVPFASIDLKEAISLLKAAGVDIYGTSLDAERYHNEISYGDKNAFVIGNEARGISPEILSLVSEKIKIPMRGQVESLNAAVSAAVVMYGVL